LKPRRLASVDKMQYWGEKGEGFMSCGRRHGILNLRFARGGSMATIEKVAT
jgi:hypothetical protein